MQVMKCPKRALCAVLLFICIVSVTTTATAQNGLVAAYSFSQGSGTTVPDSSGNNLTGTMVGATWTSAGKYGSALSFNGSSSYVDLGNPAALQLTGSMTLEAWIYAAANPADDGQIIAKSDGIGWQLKTSPDTGPHTFGVGISPDSTNLTQRYSTIIRSLGTWYHVAGVYDAATRALSIYVNGVLNNGAVLGPNIIPASQFNQKVNVNIGRRTGGYYFNGVIDEVRIYNRALSQAEIQTDMNTPIGSVSSPVAPTITTQPASRTIIAGQTATFSVTATGTAPLTYQWRKNNVNISGATSSSYTTPVTTTADNGAQFTIIVSNSAGSVTSSAATLTVNAAVSGLLNTSSSSLNFWNVNVGSSSSLSVTLTNSGSASITILGVSVAGAGFTPSGVSSGLILNGGSTAALTVVFAPAATGPVTGSVIITSTASNPTLTINLSGTGVQVTPHTVTLNWSPSTSTVSGYYVYRSTVSGSSYVQLNSSLVTATQFTDVTVQSGQTYYYVVTAMNSSNVQSAYSSQVSATIP